VTGVVLPVMLSVAGRAPAPAAQEAVALGVWVRLRVWPVYTGCAVQRIRKVLWMPDGRRLLTGGEDGLLRCVSAHATGVSSLLCAVADAHPRTRLPHTFLCPHPHPLLPHPHPPDPRPRPRPRCARTAYGTSAPTPLYKRWR
jgi:hypothetical protein